MTDKLFRVYNIAIVNLKRRGRKRVFKPDGSCRRIYIFHLRANRNAKNAHTNACVRRIDRDRGIGRD